jgi:hypothetical protein
MEELLHEPGSPWAHTHKVVGPNIHESGHMVNRSHLIYSPSNEVTFLYFLINFFLEFD